MTAESAGPARAINLNTPDLLRAALDNSRSIGGSEFFQESMSTFRAAMARMPSDVDPGAITFAVARMAMQMVDQLSAEAGKRAEDVIDHFAETYRSTIDSISE